ncbi:SIS domain-containing protein [Acuticoccus kandeliae]|uniref:SIS domain-containing protein n=1 Tax=Acuticoccus kandeliae TaxID=2073160 RepID=UPI000D3E4986|nr:SIS domain-containing protein [Acuticoccus kandeliae]
MNHDTDGLQMMAREISAQPKALSAALVPLAEAAAILALDPKRPVWIAGAGQSFAAVRTVAGLFREHGFDVRALSAAELLWQSPPEPGDTAVLLSLSGNTPRTVEAMVRARSRRARTIAVTVDPEAALARGAEQTLLLPVPLLHRGTPPTLDHTMALLALALLGGTGRDLCRRAIDRLDAAFAPLATQASAVVEAISTGSRFHFLGNGPALGSASYGALTMQLAGLDASAGEAEEITHGAARAMRPGDHAILLGDGGAADQRTAILADGLARLGLTVSRAGFAAPDRLSAAFEAALWCQLLALAIVRRRGLALTTRADIAEVERDWRGWLSP